MAVDLCRTLFSLCANRLKYIGLSLFVMTLAACSSGTLPFEGTELTAKNQATSFQLADQFGQTVSLEDFQGKVVLLTFLYTNCPDVCPITTSQLREAHALLGEDADKVAIVAVSVDPERDTVASAHRFSERWNMTDNWSYLVGTEDELRPIWKAYFIDPAVNDRDNANSEEPQESTPQAPSIGGVDALIQASYLVIHSAPIYIIDKDGIMQSLFTLPFETESLMHDVMLLLG